MTKAIVEIGGNRQEINHLPGFGLMVYPRGGNGLRIVASHDVDFGSPVEVGFFWWCNSCKD